jgi:integrase
MPTINRHFVEKGIVPPEVGQIIYRDHRLQGFALRVTHSCKSYIAECRVNGVNRRVTIGKHGIWTPEAARKEARRLLLEMSAGTDPRSSYAALITLREVLEKYLNLRTLRPNTVRSYRQIMKRCLGEWLNKPITGITKEMVQSRHRELTRLTRQGTPGKIQANMAMRILRAMLTFAADNYERRNGEPIILVNPVRRLSQNKAWHREQPRQSIIPDDKLASWYRAVTGLRRSLVRDYLLFLILTGLRRNEAAMLEWSDIDLQMRILTVRAAHSKNHREHNLPLSDFLVSLLRSRKARCHDSRHVFPGRRVDSYMVDCGHTISIVINQSGCRFTLHDLRRNFLSMAARLGMSHYIIKKLANHVSGNDVTSDYIMIDVERLRSPMSQITDQFLSLFGCSAENSISSLFGEGQDLLTSGNGAAIQLQIAFGKLEVEH